MKNLKNNSNMLIKAVPLAMVLAFVLAFALAGCKTEEEEEAGSSKDSAISLSDNVAKSGSIKSGQKVWYKFSALSTKSYAVSRTGSVTLSILTSDGATTVTGTIADSASSQVFSGYGGVTYILVKGTAAGDYSIKSTAIN
jgi:hypothetical protein